MEQETNSFQFNHGSTEVVFHQQTPEEWKIYFINKNTGKQTTVGKKIRPSEVEHLATLIAASTMNNAANNPIFGKNAKSTIANLKEAVKKEKERKE